MIYTWTVYLRIPPPAAACIDLGLAVLVDDELSTVNLSVRVASLTEGGIVQRAPAHTLYIHKRCMYIHAAQTTSCTVSMPKECIQGH